MNIIADPILIFGWFGLPKMGVAGAAIATVFSQFVGCAIGLFLLLTKDHAVEIKVFSFDIHWSTIKEIYAVGAPSIIMQALGSVMLFGMNAILAGFSSTAVAVLGVYGKLQSFVFMPSFGVNQGALPIMGYNYGARNKKRLLDTFKVATMAAIIIMTMGLIIFQTIPDLLLKLFNASPDMLAIGNDALKSISLCFIPAGFGIISAGLFQATGHGVMSMWGSILRQFAGILPLAFIFGKVFGLRAVWLSFPLAEIIGVVYYVIMLRYLYNNTFKKLGCENNE